MAEKQVSVSLFSKVLSREEKGVVFEVRNGDSNFGELVVSKGGIRWKGNKKQDHRHMSWGDLDKAMADFPKCLSEEFLNHMNHL
jgi:hypothetical protein